MFHACHQNQSGGRRPWRVSRLALALALGAATLGGALTTLAQSVKPDSKQPKAVSPTTPKQSQEKPAALSPPPAADFAPIAASGKSLVIPELLKAKGKAFHAQPGTARQVSFLSDAPFEKITGHSNGVLGFAIAGPDSDPAKLQGGEWRLPVTSLVTGNTDRDGHLASADWLDAARFPHIIFKLKDTRDTKEQTGARDPSMRSFTATLVGDMTIHGVTKEMTIPATIRFRPRSQHSSVLAEGDFLLVSCTHKVTLSDFGVSHAQITTNKKVANEIEIDTRLLLASVPPEEQPEAPTKPGAAGESRPAKDNAKK